jgi:hypothetical protein
MSDQKTKASSSQMSQASESDMDAAISTTADDAAAEESDRLIQVEIDAVREDIAAHVGQSESLLRMFKLLLQRVDVVAKRHEKAMLDNVRLRQQLAARDLQILRLQHELRLAHAALAAATPDPAPEKP